MLAPNVIDNRQNRAETAGQTVGEGQGPTGAIAPAFWTDQQAPLPPPLPEPGPNLLRPLNQAAASTSKPGSQALVKPMSVPLDVSAFRGRRIHLCLAPDQAAQEVLSAAAEGAGSAWVKRWGGWHVAVGKPVLADSIDVCGALVSAAGDEAKGVCPWELRSVQYSLRIHKNGIGLPCFCQSALKHVTRDEAVWMGPAKQLVATADRLRKLGWEKVEAKDFRLVLGPREEVRHVLSDMVAALWDARWVWLIAVEQELGSGKFVFDWASAKPAMVMPAAGSEESSKDKDKE